MYIESHQSLARHPKVRKLARMLKIGRAQAIGHLHMLWWFCLDYAQDGDISDFDAEDIAEAAGYEDGEPRDFVAALVECTLLDVDVDGNTTVHDWYDYAGNLLERLETRREGNRKRQQDWRDRHKSNQRNALRDVTPPLRNAPVTPRNGTNITNLTIEDPIPTSDPISDLDPQSKTLNGSVRSIPRMEDVQPSARLRDDVGAIDSSQYRAFVREQLRTFGVDKPSPKSLDEYSVILHGYAVRDAGRVRAECVTAAEWLHSRKNTRAVLLSPRWLNNWMDRSFNPKPTPPTNNGNGGINDAAATDAAEQRRRDRINADEAKRQALVSQSGKRLERISAMVEEYARRQIS